MEITIYSDNYPTHAVTYSGKVYYPSHRNHFYVKKSNYLLEKCHVKKFLTKVFSVFRSVIFEGFAVQMTSTHPAG